MTTLPDSDPLRAQLEDELNQNIVHPFDPGTGEWNEKLPDELRQFFRENNITDRFCITLKKFKNENFVGNAAMLCQYRNEIPNYDHIAQQWGPGAYRFMTSYKVPRAGGRGFDDKIQDHNFILEGTYYENLFRDFQEKARQVRLKQIYEQSQEDAIRRAHLLGGGPAQDPIETMSKTVTALTPILNMNRPEGGNGDLLKMLINQSTQKSDNLVPLILGMMESQSKNMVALIGLMMQNNRNGNGMENNLEGLMNLMERTMQISDRLTPKQSTIADKIVDFLTEFSGPLLEYLGKNENQRTFLEKSMVDKLKKSNEVAALRAQRALLVHVVKTADEKLGRENADGLLKVLSLNRPPECSAPAEENAEPETDGVRSESGEPDGDPLDGEPGGA